MTANAAARERSGRHAERLAMAWLRLKGFRIAATRLRTPVGEIDIVATRRDLAVFVEVKRRADGATAAHALTARQRARIEAAARLWLGDHPGYGRVRFDAVLIIPGALPRHLVDAWRPSA